MSPHKWIIAAAITLLPCLPANAEATSPPAKTRVACIGNSITYGMTLPDREHTSYPSRLQQSLGEGYEVGNSGATAPHCSGKATTLTARRQNSRMHLSLRPT